MTLARRRFCQLAIIGGASCLVACGTDSSASTEIYEVSVPLSDLPGNGVIAVSGSGCSVDQSVLIGRDAMGLYAYSNTCTHEGGTVPVPAANGISRCCLHGSQFDATGTLVKGVVAGQKDLPHYKLRIETDGGTPMIVVRVNDEELDRTMRVPVT